MARRQLLTDEQWARLLAPPSDEREIVRYWTLSREDFDIIFRKRSDPTVRTGLLRYVSLPSACTKADEAANLRKGWNRSGEHCAVCSIYHRYDPIGLGLI